MKKLLTLVLAIALVCSVATASAVTLKLSEVHAEGYPTTLADQEFARLIEERTEGRITVEVYSGGTLYGEETGAIEAMQMGDIAFARVSASPVASYVPALNAIQMPYIYKNSAHQWAVLDGEIGQAMLDSIETAKGSGLVGLCWYDSGARSFYTTKLVEKPADLAGLKIRMQNNMMMVAMVNVLGGTGVTGIGPNEVYSAITQGTIDGAENNWPTYQNMGDYEAATYYVLNAHTRVPEILLASAEVMASLDPEDVALIKEIAKETEEFEKAKWAEKEASAEEIVRGNGNTITELTQEQIDEFAAMMTTPVTGVEGIDDGKSLYEMYGSDYMDIIEQIQALGENY